MLVEKKKVSHLIQFVQENTGWSGGVAETNENKILAEDDFLPSMLVFIFKSSYNSSLCFHSTIEWMWKIERMKSNEFSSMMTIDWSDRMQHTKRLLTHYISQIKKLMSNFAFFEMTTNGTGWSVCIFSLDAKQMETAKTSINNYAQTIAAQWQCERNVNNDCYALTT